MDMQIIVEPEYSSSFWCLETLKGVKNQANLRKIRLIELTEAMLEQISSEDDSRVVIILGTSINWMNRIAALSTEKGFVCLLVTGDQGSQVANRVSTVLMDYQNSMNTLLSHLKHAGDNRIAFYGANPNSYADSIKSESFPWKKDIYYNFGSIATCTNQLWNRIDNYNAVICANSAIAVYLLHYLLDKGLRIPKDIQLISFGDFFLSEVMNPSITSVLQDYRELGMQAVNVYSFLAKNPQLIINVFIRCPLKIRESTGEKTLATLSGTGWVQENPPDINFYDDENISPLLSLERLLVESDDLDILILKKLVEKETQEKIAEDLNLALSSLRYRIKKMRDFFPDSSRKMMMETVECYLPAEVLERAVALKRNLMY